MRLLVDWNFFCFVCFGVVFFSLVVFNLSRPTILTLSPISSQSFFSEHYIPDVFFYFSCFLIPSDTQPYTHYVWITSSINQYLPCHYFTPASRLYFTPSPPFLLNRNPLSKFPLPLDYPDDEQLDMYLRAHMYVRIPSSFLFFICCWR